MTHNIGVTTAEAAFGGLLVELHGLPRIEAAGGEIGLGRGDQPELAAIEGVVDVGRGGEQLLADLLGVAPVADVDHPALGAQRRGDQRQHERVALLVTPIEDADMIAGAQHDRFEGELHELVGGVGLNWHGEPLRRLDDRGSAGPRTLFEPANSTSPVSREWTT